jgi:PhzF family phenazine biosynthesis protein
MKIPQFQIDAFTDQVFKGNPAAVCPLETWLDDAVLKSIANENNLSETAFFVKEGRAYHIRWFTPAKVEIDLCGHATIATAFVIFNNYEKEAQVLNFISKSGALKVLKKEGLLYLDFPARMPDSTSIPKELLDAFNIKPQEVLKSRDYFLVFEKEEEVFKLKPDFYSLKKLDITIIATAPGKQYDFVSRFFAPSAGIDEDPVTGSAHCSLIPYWSKKLGKERINAFQASERSGKLYCVNQDDRVLIGGNCVQFMKGEIEF